MIRRYLVLILLGLFFSIVPIAAAAPPMLNCALIIDPGHGGAEKGAPITDEISEDEITLGIAKHLRDFVAQHGVRVYLTRDIDDPEAAITDSRQRVNRAYARALEDGVPHDNTALIALHADALFNTRASGTMVYIPEPKMTRGKILRLLTEKARSKCFATGVLEKLRTQGEDFPVYNLGEPIRSVVREPGGKAYSPAVLRDTFPPVRILIEAGNARNTGDATHLADTAWQREFARIVAEAYVEHFMLPTSYLVGLTQK